MQVNCLICNKLFYVRPSGVARGEGKTCSRKCMGIRQKSERSGANNPNWKGGVAWQSKIRDKVRYALQKGVIKKFTCEVCDESKVEAHHCDYNKPLEVMWLCRKHHNEWHRNNQAIYPQ